jgi:glucose-6-phosphate 1-epimerase
LIPSGPGAALLWSAGDAWAAELNDLGAAWRQTVCLETANFFDVAITLAPGASRAVGVRYEIELI